MKPTDLKIPAAWKEARVLLADQILIVPSRCEDFGAFLFPGWETVFGNNHPVNLEYCSGNGAWIVEKALQSPFQNFVAVERKFDRVRKIWSKIKNHQINNLLIIFGEGFSATKHYIPSHSIDRVFINFPDPWPKTRHHKNRIIQLPFLSEASRILKEKGDLTFVTDDAPYSEWTIDLMERSTLFSSVYPAPYYITENESYGSSSFQQLWQEKGRTIRYHRFERL